MNNAYYFSRQPDLKYFKKRGYFNLLTTTIEIFNTALKSVPLLFFIHFPFSFVESGTLNCHSQPDYLAYIAIE